MDILRTADFAKWVQGLRDHQARMVILARVARLSLGHLGDVRPVGQGVSEMRIHHGPGYRVYFMQRGLEIVILLAGGDKSSQARDIQQALQLARQIKESEQ